MMLPSATGPSARTTGIVLMTAAAFAIQIIDGLAKHLSADYSPLFIGWARYGAACLIVLPCAAAIHGRRLFPAERLGSHLTRTVLLAAAMTLYFLALARIPMATAISAYFVAPIIAVVVSVLVLKERMTAMKAASLALGFIGAMVIVQPGTAVEPGILLAIGAGLASAFYMIATRQAATVSDPLKTLTFQCAVGAVLLLPVALPTWRMPATADLPLFLALGVFSLIGHLLAIVAFRLADTSTLAPLVYVELIGAALIGYFAFGDVPGWPTIVGAALIVGAGLLLMRQRDEKPLALPEPAA